MTKTFCKPEFLLAMSCQRHAQLLWKCLLGSLQLWITPYFASIISGMLVSALTKGSTPSMFNVRKNSRPDGSVRDQFYQIWTYQTGFQDAFRTGWHACK
jgi:hypothetical protein